MAKTMITAFSIKIIADRLDTEYRYKILIKITEEGYDSDYGLKTLIENFNS